MSAVTFLSTYSQTRQSPFTVHIPPALYAAGSTIYGEIGLNVNVLREDDVERIYVELQGTILTKNRVAAGADQFQVITNEFLRKSITVWERERIAYPTPGEAITVPFELELPEDTPPSFGFESHMNNAHVRYAVKVVGVRAKALADRRTVKLPIVVISRDPIGSGARAQLKLGWPNGWGRLKAEDDIRKYPWGEYSHVKLELLVPHLDTFPLFTDIPYTIVVTTLSAPTKRKSNVGPDKNHFPPVPRSPSEIDFEMRRFVDMETPYKPSHPEEHVVDIISKAHAPIPPVGIEIGEHTWIPEGREDRGRWRQEATFHSSMKLRYTPTFLTGEVKIKYTLFLRIEFPGSGNALRLCMPITIGSGVESSIPFDPSSPKAIDLPASYWDPLSWANR